MNTTRGCAVDPWMRHLRRGWRQETMPPSRCYRSRVLPRVCVVDPTRHAKCRTHQQVGPSPRLRPADREESTWIDKP